MSQNESDNIPQNYTSIPLPTIKSNPCPNCTRELYEDRTYCNVCGWDESKEV